MEENSDTMWQSFAQKTDELFMLGYNLPTRLLQIHAADEVHKQVLDWKNILSKSPNGNTEVEHIEHVDDDADNTDTVTLSTAISDAYNTSIYLGPYRNISPEDPNSSVCDLIEKQIIRVYGHDGQHNFNNVNINDDHDDDDDETAMIERRKQLIKIEPSTESDSVHGVAVERDAEASIADMSVSDTGNDTTATSIEFDSTLQLQSICPSE